MVTKLVYRPDPLLFSEAFAVSFESGVIVGCGRAWGVIISSKRRVALFGWRCFVDGCVAVCVVGDVSEVVSDPAVVGRLVGSLVAGVVLPTAIKRKQIHCF